LIILLPSLPATIDALSWDQSTAAAGAPIGQHFQVNTASCGSGTQLHAWSMADESNKAWGLFGPALSQFISADCLTTVFDASNLLHPSFQLVSLLELELALLSCFQRIVCHGIYQPQQQNL
jgi:hypothetical protein